MPKVDCQSGGCSLACVCLLTCWFGYLLVCALLAFFIRCLFAALVSFGLVCFALEPLNPFILFQQSSGQATMQRLKSDPGPYVYRFRGPR